MITNRRRGLLLKILANKEARGELVKRLREQGLAPKVGKIGDGEILKILLEHADVIIKIIEAVAKMFML